MSCWNRGQRDSTGGESRGINCSGEDWKEQDGVTAGRRRKGKKKSTSGIEVEEQGAREQLKDRTNILEDGVTPQAYRAHTRRGLSSPSA